MAEEKEYLKVVDDQVGTPTCAKELAIAISKLVETDLYRCNSIVVMRFFLFVLHVLQENMTALAK